MKHFIEKALSNIFKFLMFKSVVSKIIVGFFLMIMISIVIGLVGLTKINQMYDVGKNIFTDNTSTLAPLEDLLQNVYAMHLYASSAVIGGDKNAVSKIAMNINNTSGMLSNLQYTFDSTTYQEIQRHGAGYDRATRDLYNELSHNGANSSLLYKRYEAKSDELYSYIYELSKKYRINGMSTFDQAKKIYNSAFGLQIVITFSGLIIAILVGLWISLSILRPLRQLKNKTELLAKGDLQVQVDIKADNEIGAVGHAFNRAVDELRSMVKHSLEYSKRLNVSCDELFRVAEGASSTLQNINQLVEELTKGASTQSDTVEHTIDTIQEASKGSNLVINATLAINTVSKEASLSTTRGGDAVAGMVKTVDGLVSTVNEIDRIIQDLALDSKQIQELADVIREIADQTSLLALNASIEAARAGQGTEGFGVIAQHIRKLAARSEESAKHIHSVVNLIDEKTKMAVAAAKVGTEGVVTSRNNIVETATLFQDLVKRLAQITDQIGHIAETSSQMGAGNKKVISEMEVVSQISQDNLAAAEEVSATFQEQYASMLIVTDAARQLRVLAEQLSESAERFAI